MQHLFLKHFNQTPNVSESRTLQIMCAITLTEEH